MAESVPLCGNCAKPATLLRENFYTGERYVTCDRCHSGPDRAAWRLADLAPDDVPNSPQRSEILTVSQAVQQGYASASTIRRVVPQLLAQGHAWRTGTGSRSPLRIEADALRDALRKRTAPPPEKVQPSTRRKRSSGSSRFKV